MKSIKVAAFILLLLIGKYAIAQNLKQLLKPWIDIIVAQDGTGNAGTVQAAINLVPDGNQQRKIIFIRNGVYKEKITVSSAKPFITLVGEDVDKVILTWDDFSGKVVNGDTIRTNTSFSFAADASDFIALNLTFANSAGPVGQAVALRTNADRQVFYHCKIIGHQDTYYTFGHYRNFLKDCFIEGTTDYIFGRSTVVFDSCHINSLKTGSFITAASTEKNARFGYVFFNSRFTSSPQVEKVFLGRPWRPFARTVIVESFLDGSINPAGWSVWRGNENHRTCYYAEYQNTGPGADSSMRIEWAHQLNHEEIADYTIENIFAKETNPEYFSESWKPDIESSPFIRIIKANTKRFLGSL